MEFKHPIDRVQLRAYIQQFEENGDDLNDLCNPSNNPLLDLIADRSESEKAAVLSMVVGEVRSKINTKNPSSAVNQPAQSTESDNVDLIGMLIIFTSIVATVICIFSFGKTAVVDSYYGGYSRDWSGVAVFSWICVGISGVLFGYLFKKIASVLRHLEKINSNGD